MSASLPTSPHNARTRRPLLFVNLDFQDFIYSHLWGRAVVDACAQRKLAVDMVTVNPFVFGKRDLAVELGVSQSAIELPANAAVVYVDQPDESHFRSVIDALLDRHRYDTLILNCEAALFLHLIIDREQDLAGARWLVYDRHLHVDLRAHEGDPHLRQRMIASGMHLFILKEIATGSGDEGAAIQSIRRLRDRVVAAGSNVAASQQGGNVLVRSLKRLRGRVLGSGAQLLTNPAVAESLDYEGGIVRSFKNLGLTTANIHLQPWPLDDVFFAPQPAAAREDAFVIFSGGDSGRDYATLFEAIEGLPVQLRLCAHKTPTPVPANVTILPRLFLHEFRDEIARATAVVVPLTGSPPVSGITVIAMAQMMGRPVIASDNPVVRMHIPSHGSTGYLTPLRDAATLHAQLCRLIDSPAERERLGRQARARAASDLSLKAFVERMLDAGLERAGTA